VTWAARLVRVLSAVALVPSAPVMIAELAGAAATETADLRVAAVSAARGLPPRWVGVGVASEDAVVSPDAVGTFAGYGVDLPVALSAAALGGQPARLPLCVLVTAWLRGTANPAASAEVHTYRGDHPAEAAVALGRRLRADLDAFDEPTGVLVVADGANTLTPAAPGGYDPDALAGQHALDDALAGGAASALVGLSESAVGRVAYQVLAGLVAPAPRSADELYRGAPYGVGYFVGRWTP